MANGQNSFGGQNTNDSFGALGNITDEEFGNLSRGLQATNNPIASVFGYDITPEKAFTTAVGFVAPPLSAPMAIGSFINDYKTNQLANKALGRPTSFMSGFSNKSLQDLRNEIDVNNDRNISNRELQNFNMANRGKTAYDVGLNPAAGYTPGSVSIQNLAGFGKADPDAGLGGINTTGQVADVMTQRQVDDMFSGIDTTSGVTGLGGGKGASYSGITNFSLAEGVDTDDPESTGSTGVSVANQSYADDAQSSGTGGGDGTYICTALYDMGDMRAYIYKYDQLYGRKVNPNVYRGYCLWGKYVATKMKRQGWTYRIVKPLALAWAKQMAFDLSKGRHGKKNTVVKVISKIGEGICYALGFVANLKTKKGVKYG